MRWTIQGADAKTGAPVDVTAEAIDRDAAEFFARSKGIVRWSIEEAPTPIVAVAEPAPIIAYACSSTEATPSAAPSDEARPAARMRRMRTCPDCAWQLGRGVGNCPNCGRAFTRWYVWAMAALILLVVLWALLPLLRFRGGD